jgi:UDP-glucose 4-epimerase
MDLAEGHAAALKFLSHSIGYHEFNLGSGKGYSVLEMVRAFEIATGCKVPYKVVARRAGDVAACYADPKKASQLLNWYASRSLEDMCASTWRFNLTNRLGMAQ